jgi:hypothetical protein
MCAFIVFFSSFSQISWYFKIDHSKHIHHLHEFLRHNNSDIAIISDNLVAQLWMFEL